MGYFARNGKYYVKKETRKEYEARKLRERHSKTFEGEFIKTVGGGILFLILLGMIF